MWRVLRSGKSVCISDPSGKSRQKRKKSPYRRQDSCRGKQCRYSNPLHIKALIDPDIAAFETDVRSLDRFSDEDINEMGNEWSRYIAACRQEVAREDDNDPDKVMERICLFWNARWGAYPALSEFVQYCFSIPTSSAAAERIFSILKRSIDKSQMVSSLEDTTQTTLLLRYNKAAFDVLLI